MVPRALHMAHDTRPTFPSLPQTLNCVYGARANYHIVVVAAVDVVAAVAEPRDLPPPITVECPFASVNAAATLRNSSRALALLIAAAAARRRVVGHS